MKILSYNIMSGGFNSYDDESKVPSRLEHIKQVIAVNKPDVVSLIDTFKWDEIYTHSQLCAMFNYKYAYSINLDDARLKSLGHNNGITVLSNVDNTKFETISLSTRTAMQTKLNVGSGRSMEIFSVYLDDLSEKTRLSQVQELEKHFTPSTPTLLIGDFNTLSPPDVSETKKRVDAFLTQNPKYASLKEQLYEMLSARVVSELLKQGFADAADDLTPTFPTKLTEIADEALLRIDLCFYKNIEVKKFLVPKGDVYEETSDHYPILVEI